MLPHLLVKGAEALVALQFTWGLGTDRKVKTAVLTHRQALADELQELKHSQYWSD